MNLPYDKYYHTENLFGEPYPELIDYFSTFTDKGKVLDLGCGQGRDAIPLARMGFAVTGVDNSEVGIGQMMRIALKENLNLEGKVLDIFRMHDFSGYDFILLDSMFHFTKRDKKRESELIKRIISNIKNGCQVIICIQDTGNKMEILKETLDQEKQSERLVEKKYSYVFEDKESGHKSETPYRMIVVRKDEKR